MYRKLFKSVTNTTESGLGFYDQGIDWDDTTYQFLWDVFDNTTYTLVNGIKYNDDLDDIVISITYEDNHV